MRNSFQLLIAFFCVFLLAACGEQSQQDVTKDVVKKWMNTNYDIAATMELKTTTPARTYDIQAWHTAPAYYRVQVQQQGAENDSAQIIVRNDDGVFVVTPATKKTYKFQSDWPKQNSQAYLINALAEELQADKAAKMTVEEEAYVFEFATRNGEKTGMPIQAVTVDQKTLLPTKVAVFNKEKEEQMTIIFLSIDTKKQHTKEEYAVEKFEQGEQSNTASEATPFEIFYPNVQFDNTLLAEEQLIGEEGTERSILTFEGDKPFTLVQQRAKQQLAPVFAAGDLVDLGFTISALTPTSISWEQNGMSFFIASTKLTQEELIQVASSMVQSSLK